MMQSFMAESLFFQGLSKLGWWKTLFKLAPAEAHALTAIEATLIPQQILQEQSVDLDKDIRKITVRTHAAACLIINKSGHLNNAADRDHCMQYILAVALLKGTQPEACDYSDNSPWAVDRRVEDLREKIEIFESAQYTIDYLDEEERSMTSALTVVFGDGSRTKEIAIDYPLGSPKHAGTRKAVDTKVHQNLSLLYSDEAIEQICKVVTSDDETLVHDFVDILWRGRETSW